MLSVADRVLMIEDDERLAAMVSEYLAENGLQVTVAPRAERGLALLARTYLAGTISVRGVILLDVAAVGSALAVGTVGTLRLVGRGPDLRWFAAGVVSGVAVAWLR